ncbi:GntR family transcriptional regulator [Mangrovicoccus ximenensis]|uniref:hypothetical protein n=1 Tax=Mangrovicoccus ximenensis TaxID=1911570 RepID=UPI000D3B6C43|nr:hypothetical protein [Mangrovicoccus ximenensis]
MADGETSHGGIAALLAGLDRGLDAPPAAQLRGILEYGILIGTLRPGDRLPTVRELRRLRSGLRRWGGGRGSSAPALPEMQATGDQRDSDITILTSPRRDAAGVPGGMGAPRA